MGTGLYTEVIHNEVTKYQWYLIRCEHMVGDREMISVEEKSLNDMYISSHVPPTPQQGGNQSVANSPFLYHKRVGPSHLTTSEIKKLRLADRRSGIWTMSLAKVSSTIGQ